MAARWQENYSIYLKYLQNIVLLYQNKEDVRIYTELILSLLTMAFFALFAIKPTLVTIGGLNKQIEGKKQTISTLDQKLKNLIAAQALYEQEKAKINLLETALPEDPMPDLYLRQIEGLTQKNAVTIDKLEIERVNLLGESLETADEEAFTTIPLSASFSGTYQPILALLTDIENLRRPFSFKTANLSLKEDIPGELMLSIEGEVLYFLNNQ